MTPEGVGAVRATMRRVERSVTRVSARDPEDAVQEAAARAVQHGIDLGAEPWLKTVAKRVAIDGLRRKREIASGAPTELERYVREHDGNPEGFVLRAERSAEVRQALSSISPRYRNALVTYMEEESPAAVARKLGLSPSATWTLLSRARASMRSALERSGFTPVVIFAREHWRALATGAAAVGAAASIAIIPGTRPSAPSAPRPPAAIVRQAAAKPAAAAHVGNVAPINIVKRVVAAAQGVVRTAEKVPMRVGVHGCNGQTSFGRVDFNFWIVQDGDTPGVVASAIPEPLRNAVMTNC